VLLVWDDAIGEVAHKDFWLFSIIEFFIQVHCSDGKLSMQGLIFAYLCSYIDR
jgi:hypothetical protein